MLVYLTATLKMFNHLVINQHNFECDLFKLNAKETIIFFNVNYSSS